jgi:hypothetical protein
MREKTKISWNDITAPRKRLKRNVGRTREDGYPKITWDLEEYEEGQGYAGQRMEIPIQTFSCLIRVDRK